jgi:hypothetical protein
MAFLFGFVGHRKPARKNHPNMQTSKKKSTLKLTLPHQALLSQCETSNSQSSGQLLSQIE